MLEFFNQIAGWRKKHVPQDEHFRIARDYFRGLSGVAEFPEWLDDRWDPLRNSSHREMIYSSIFQVPRLKNLDQNNDGINSYQLLEGFLSFLLQLLFHKTDPVDGRIQILEEELRYLLTILGDISWMLVGCHQLGAEFQNLLAEFEAVANGAGGFVHSLLFSTRSRDRWFKKMDKKLAAVLNQTELFKANLQSADISIPPYVAAKTSRVNSLLIITSLVDELEGLLKQEDDRISDVKYQIYPLYQGLSLSTSLINGIRYLGELKEPLMRIGDVAHQAQYLITAFLVKDAPLWYVINRLTALNHNVELIQTELQLITKKYQSIEGLKVEKYLSAQLSLQDRRQAGVNEIIVGSEDKAINVLDQLVGGGGRERLQAISIFGMPGLGKTTLANKLYNHPLVNYKFQKLSWCVVSQTFKRQSILAKILIQINGDLVKDKILKMEEETLVEKIYKTLKGSRYLIVLDDVWDSNVWYELQRCFPDDGNGSRILFTNRNRDVAPPNSIIHELPLLSDEQCWELLEKKVFGSRTCPPKLQQIGKKIAEKCSGLPLTVIVVAGILSTVNEEESKWEEVEGSLASYIDGEENAVMRTLELSYNQLQDHLKPCFLYFGTFEEDREISVKKLMRLWVAQGFICKEKEKSKEDIGREYLMELINKSLVMVTKRSSDGRGVKACIVHDLLRDMCLRKCEEESFLKYMRMSCPTMYDKDQHLLYVYGESYGEYLYARDMRSLRALLYFYGGLRSGRVFGIEYLVNLRSLVVDGTWEYIDRLPKLEYLCSEFMGTVYLRPSILKTNKLRCIFAKYLEYDENWNCCETNSLESLSWITIKKLRDEELLKYSPHLRRLKCSYTLSSEVEDYPHFDLRFLTQLHSLSLQFPGPWGTFKLEEFRFPSNIKKLTLSGSKLSWEKMSIIGGLEHLEVLKLLWISAEGERWVAGDGGFRKLRFLKMERLFFSEWMVETSEHFPALQHLILSYCHCLKEIPREIGEVTTLELIEVKGDCPSSVVESAERIKEEQLDMGNEGLTVLINTGHKRFAL